MRLAVTENIIFRKMISGWPQISPLTRKWISPLIFTSIHFRKERERERERESARAREEKIQSEIASSSSSPTARSTARSWSCRRSRSGAIAISDRDRSVIAIAIQIAIASRRSRSRRDRDLVLWSLMIFFPGLWLCVFWFVFSFFFSKHQKIFSGKFFETQPNTWKYFHFPEISISGKYVFSRKRFTATKHSLKILFFQEIEVINNNWDNTFLFFKRDRTIV